MVSNPLCYFYEQDGAGTELEPESGPVGTESGTGTDGTVFQEPKPEPEPCFPLKTALRHRGTLSPEEPSKPKTGTVHTASCANQSRTELRQSRMRYVAHESYVFSYLVCQ